MSNKHHIDCETAQRLLALGTLSSEPPPPPEGSGEALPHFLLSENGLGAAERSALRAHLESCGACRGEVWATAEILGTLCSSRHLEPSPSSLARARLRLEEALDREASQTGWRRSFSQLSFHAGRLRAAPGLAAVLLAVGLGLGFWGGFRSGHAVRLAEAREIVLDSAEHPHTEVVADVNRITRLPAVQPGEPDRLEIRYDLLTPESITGTAEDASIRRLLAMGLENGLDPAVRSASLDLLAAGCQEETALRCGEPALRGVMVRTLLTDEDARVRLQALDGLAPWVGADTGVRDAVLHAVMGDPSEEVRMEGIRLLRPVEVDSSVREALHTVAARDGNPRIRSVSAEVLAGVPQVQ